ncbi:SH3 domain-containing protein [Granulibacter bethesdensis]|nr:SH3 domain-containing protein [Granulibacter bethesdensis]
MHSRLMSFDLPVLKRSARDVLLAAFYAGSVLGVGDAAYAQGSPAVKHTPPSHHHKATTHKTPVVSPPHHGASGDKVKASPSANAHATGKHVPKTAAAAAAGAATAGAAAATAAAPAAEDKNAKPKPTPPDPHKGSATGLPIPRFAALRADEVNMRVGPDTRYPIEWVYKRRELPVEIVREFQVWRLVQDQEGVKGWVHQATLTGRRTFLTLGQNPVTLRRRADDESSAVAILKPGVVGRIQDCEAKSEWCQVQVKSYRGYLRRSTMWGLLPDEVITH